MSDHVLHSSLSSLDVPEISRPEAGIAADAPTGKPYRWELPVAEDPRAVALPPEAMTDTFGADATMFRNALVRTSAFLVVVSRNNGYEGRDPAVITDDLTCGTVADMLGIDIDTLARVLLDLKRRDLAEITDSGMLRLRDIEALDQLSGG